MTKIKYTGDINDIMKSIKCIMINKDIRQKDIVTTSNLSKSTISNLLAGRTPNPSLEVINNLCRAIGCDLYIDIVDSDANKKQ